MTQFTKKEIRNSFIKLLEDKSLDKISVKDIVEDCNISRNTFYYHYHDIFNVLEEILDTEILTVIKGKEHFDSINEIITLSTAFIRENKKAILHIHNSSRKEYVLSYLCRSFEEALAKYIKERVQDRDILETDFNLLVVFYKHGMIGLIEEWLNNRMDETDGESIKRLAYLLDSNIDKSLNKIVIQK